MRRFLLSLCCLGLMLGLSTFTLVGCGEEEQPAPPSDPAESPGAPPYAQPGAGRTPARAPGGNQ